MTNWADGDYLTPTNLNTRKPTWAPSFFVDVADYGAVGDGTTDDTQAFISAISAAGSGNLSGAVLVSGNSFYKISSTLTLTNRHLLGSYHGNPSQGPFIFGTINAPLVAFSGTGGSIIGLGLQQLSTGANASCISIGGTMVQVSHCYGQSYNHGLIFGDSVFAATADNCYFEGIGSNGAKTATNGSVGVFVQGASINGVRCVGFDHGFRVGNGFCRMGHIETETNYVGVGVGFALNGSSLLAQGVEIHGGEGEANDTGLYLNNVAAIHASGLRFLATTNCPSGGGIYGLRVGTLFDAVIEGAAFTFGGGSTYSVAAVEIGNGCTNAVFAGIGVTSGSSLSISSTAPGVTAINCNFMGNPVGQYISQGSVIDVQHRTKGGRQFLQIGNASVTTLSDFTNSVVGLPIYIQATFNNNTVLPFGPNIFSKTGAPRSLQSGEVIQLVRMDSTSSRWDEVGGVNPDGTAIAPGIPFYSESSLGWYRSGSSTMALSYGTLNLRGGALSLRTTASAGSSSNLTQGEFCLVATSTTSAQLAFKSGNTTYLFNADVASP